MKKASFILMMFGYGIVTNGASKNAHYINTYSFKKIPLPITLYFKTPTGTVVQTTFSAKEIVQL